MANIHADFKEFRSDLDGTVIRDRKQLKEHNERNNVTNSEDFSDSYLAEQKYKREQENTDDMKNSRIEAVSRAVDAIERRKTEWCIDAVSITTNPEQVYLD